MDMDLGADTGGGVRLMAGLAVRGLAQGRRLSDRETTPRRVHPLNPNLNPAISVNGVILP